MNFSLQSIRVAALISAAAILSLAQGAIAASTVVTVNASSATANGVSLCQDTPQLQMDPAGNLNVVCTPVGSGGTTFACSFANQIIPNTGGPVTLTAACQNGSGAVTINWTAVTAGAPVLDAATGTVVHATMPANTGTTAQVYQYRIDATDSASTPNSATYTGSVTVTPPGSACATTTTNGTFTGFTGPTYSGLMPPGGYIAYAFPVFTPAQGSAGKSVTVKLASASGSPSTINIEVAVSHCPGDFSPAETACVADGVTSTFRMYPYAGVAETPGTTKCTMAAGTQYYLNIRPVQKDHVTPSCTVQSLCGVVVNWSIAQ